MGFINLDSIIANTPKRLTVDITTTDNKKQHIDVYWMAVNKRSKNLLRPNDDTPDEFDPDRFYAVTNNNQDTMIIQSKTFNKVFRKGFEFYQADDK